MMFISDILIGIDISFFRYDFIFRNLFHHSNSSYHLLLYILFLNVLLLGCYFKSEACNVNQGLQVTA